jgi:hypothetical protein
VQLRLEPFQIAAGREREIFQIIDPGFTEEVVVNRIDVHMKEKSHHFILYTWNDRGRVPGPGHRELLSSTGVGTGARGFVVGAQSSFESFQFPEGTGIPFAAGTVFDFNSHYLNLDGEETLLGEVYVNLFFAPAGEPVRRIVSDIYGPTALHIPPGQTVSSGGTWPAGGVPAERHIHSLSSHMHRHGDFFEATLVRQDGASEEIYESANWDDPVFKVFDPPLVLQRGDRLRFSCTHTNHDRDVPIRWGFTSEDEMCFLLFQYSTPSR